MKRNLFIFFLLTIFFQVSSCKKFLEEQSQTDIIPRSASALNELLIGAAYNETSGTGVDYSLNFLDDDTMEDTFYPIGGDLYFTYTWQPQSLGKPDAVPGASSWRAIYPRILGCNIVLDYVPKVSGTIAELENVAGQAYLLRAFYYFRLVNLYGKPYIDQRSNPAQDLGVPLILSSDLSFEGRARNTVAEVYTQILKDLDKGIELLERNGKNDNKYRINHIAGYLLSSRVHLYLGEWQKAIDAATAVLNRKSDLMDLNTWGPANQNGKQIIAMENTESIWGFDPSMGVIPVGSEMDNYRLSDDLLSNFEQGDLRRSIYINGNRSIKRASVHYLGKVAQVFRVSEALLNRAEAYAQLNKLGQTTNAQLALNDLNTLRKKRFTPAAYQDLSSSGADDLLQKCYEEKRREFFAEESHRWFDLRRHGMPAIEHVFHESNSITKRYILKERDPAYVFQIPKGALDKNSKLILNPDPAPRTGF